MIFEVSVSVHPPIFLDLQIAVPGLTLEAEREAKTKAPCKSGRLTESSLHRDLSCCKERRSAPNYRGCRVEGVEGIEGEGSHRRPSLLPRARGCGVLLASSSVAMT
jgi:hypothetical protein